MENTAPTTLPESMTPTVPPLPSTSAAAPVTQPGSHPVVHASPLIKIIQVMGLVAIVILAGIGGYLIGLRQNSLPPVQNIPDPQTINPDEPIQVACTLEAKQCPDGSYVGRTGPNCEFTACPDEVTPSVSPQ